MVALSRISRIDRLRPLLPEREWARVESYLLDDCGHGTDVFGTTPAAFGAAWALAYWLHRSYFRVVSAGHDHIPRRGAAVIAGNHSGVLPFDAMMLAADVFRYTEPPRLVRYMVDYFVYRVPWLGTFFRGLGQIPGTRRNFDGLVEQGHLVGVFPEGAAALGKPARERYRLYPFSHGHVELAARHRIPVIPFGLVGAEEQQTMLLDIRPLARILRLPYVPVTTTFPWLGPVGLLPRPVRYYLHFGTPLDIDPDAERSVEVRSREVDRVRDAVAEQVELGLQVRRRRQEGGA
jgi:1-acyl-sn-glycerol-3-phosphate acyltransferase